MKYPKNAVKLFAVILSLLVLLVVTGCGDDGGGTSGPKLPADPGSGNLAGMIVGTINERALAGVTVSVGPVTTTTDSDGIFRLDGVGEGILSVIIEGGSIYTRRAAVDTANGRSVLLDAIEINSGFNLDFYREIARKNHPAERASGIFVTFRWVNPTPPTFYIDTDASMTLDGTIDQDTINAVRSAIKSVVAPFTGNFYSSVTIKTQPFSRLDFNSTIPDNSFVITFDDTLINDELLGVTYSRPVDYPTSTVNTINQTLIFLVDFSLMYSLNGTPLDMVTAHEIGHGFGFWHTSLFPSIMNKFLELTPSGGFYSDTDRLHMGVVYKRPSGNTDIDNDPVPGAKMVGRSPEILVHIDKMPKVPELSPELIERLESLNERSKLDDTMKQYIHQ